MSIDLPRLPVAVLLSGGLDSGILVGHLLREGYRVYALYVRSGLRWEGAELRAVRRLLGELSGRFSGFERLVVLRLPLADLYEDHWSITGSQAPDANSPDQAVYLPGRNALLLVKPAYWCQMHGIEQLALGVLGTSPFADATAEFFDAFQSAVNRGALRPVRLIRPFAALTKREVMQLGRDLPLGHTFSCIAPSRGLHCGQCNKCAERQQAFRSIGAVDPTVYAQPPAHVRSGRASPWPDNV